MVQKKHLTDTSAHLQAAPSHHSRLPPLQMGLPATPLRPWVDHYKWGTLRAPLVVDVISLPAATTEIVITSLACMQDHHPNGTLKPKPNVFVFGPMHTERCATLEINAQSTVHLFSITFRPGVFPLLFGESAQQAANQINDPELLLPHARQEALLELCQRPMDMANLAHVELMLLSWIQPLDISQLDLRAQRVLSAIQGAPSQVDVASLAQQHYVSTRHLERLFQLHFGFGPKHFARMWRFRQAAQALIHQPKSRTLCALASELGFSDQAHMTREFKRFAGVSPSQYVHKRDSKLYLPSTWADPL